jgi:hypothetical protein
MGQGQSASPTGNGRTTRAMGRVACAKCGGCGGHNYPIALLQALRDHPGGIGERGERIRLFRGLVGLRAWAAVLGRALLRSGDRALPLPAARAAQPVLALRDAADDGLAGPAGGVERGVRKAAAAQVVALAAAVGAGGDGRGSGGL